MQIVIPLSPPAEQQRTAPKIGMLTAEKKNKRKKWHFAMDVKKKYGTIKRLIARYT
jgi:hypothetical protein